MARRQSRRLQGLLPEVQSTHFTCFCLVEGEAIDPGVLQTSCCRQFVHQSCYRQWLRTHTTCPLCRHHHGHPVGQPPLQRMDNAAIIERLSRLLSDPNLDQILSHLRTHTFFLPLILMSHLILIRGFFFQQYPFSISRGEFHYFICHLLIAHTGYELGESPHYPYFLIEVIHTALPLRETTGIFEMLNDIFYLIKGALVLATTV